MHNEKHDINLMMQHKHRREDDSDRWYCEDESNQDKGERR
jgi:hypothetical protein